MSSEFDDSQLRMVHEARVVALRDITSAAADAVKVVDRKIASAKPGRWPLTILILVLVFITLVGCVGLIYQQVETNHQNQVLKETCALRNSNGHLAKTLYEDLARDAQSSLYRADFQRAADGLQFQDCSKI